MGDELEVLEGEVADDLLPALLPVAAGAAEALVGLRQAIADLDAQREALALAGDMDSLAVGLVAVQMLVRDLRTLAHDVEADLSRIMGVQGERSLTIEGVGLFERKRSTSRKAWQTPDLARRLVEQAMERGEVDHPFDVMDLFLRFASISGWRVTPLREVGLDPADWCEENEDGYSIKITPPGSAPK